MGEYPSEIKPTVAQRFEFIEWRAYWAGFLNRKDLEDEFQISTPQASIDLRNYQELAPGNIEYDATEKTFKTTGYFRPKFMVLSPEHYLIQLQAIATGALRKKETWFDTVPPIEVPRPIARGPEAYVLRELLRAIENRTALNINYQSLTSTRERNICPHAFVNDGYRWHVRAWSVEQEEFRDYVLGRIKSYGAQSPCSADPSDDIEWQTEITLRLVAHPHLDERQRETIEYEYRMENGALQIPMRLALAFYFVKRHNLDLRKGEISPARAQLFLENFDQYETELAAAKSKSKTLASARRR